MLLPCYNEEATIGATITGFRKVLPDATVYVYDNNSTDRTAELSRAGGATVVFEPVNQIARARSTNRRTAS